MSTNQGGKSTNIPSAAAEVGNEFQNSLGSIDTVAAQRLQTLQLVHQARLSQLTRALADARSQYPADSPEVKSAEAAVAATAQTVGQVSIVHEQLKTPDPEVAAAGWALHGRVFDADWKPVSGFTVFLVDAQKAYQREFGFSYTDRTGYFLINYAGPQTTPAQPPKSASRQSTTVPQLFLEIADTKAQPVYLSQTAFQPGLGTTTYQNVVLSADQGPIGDPPKEIREIALPNRKKKSSPGPSKSR